MPITATSRKGVISQVLGEFRRGSLNIGRSSKKVKSRKQALAIALDIARKRKR